ncbi:hypothetical protein C2G38_2181214 [Gigaspora rosea]|uniref:Uncharacterized protein n=1 Tax=Gigaspora rosea TaxID=44941 RepID=A0A397VB51_9GLOM|nr:hypothetical protein C2G38_2181214 [Gigaspora rosea]
MENVHSKIQANTSQNASADSVIKQAYFIMNHDPTFKNTYCKTRQYLYTMMTLNFLYDKIALFLLQNFQNIFYNCGRNLRHLPTAYSTVRAPCSELYDSCGRLLVNNNSMKKINLPRNIDDDEIDVESQEEKCEDVEELDFSSKLIAEINQIEYW